jgi:hypothetical protein
MNASALPQQRRRIYPVALDFSQLANIANVNHDQAFVLCSLIPKPAQPVVTLDTPP